MSEGSSSWLRVGCEFVHELEWPVAFTLQVEPRLDAVLGLRENQLETEPEVSVHRHLDLYGNVCRRLTLGPGRTRIRYQAEVEVTAAVDDADGDAAQVPVAELPDDVLHFTLASRYCDSDRLSNTAWALFGGVPEGWMRVQAVVDWVHENLTFTMGSSTPATGASDVYVERRGVCRDFAHLAVAFLRGLNVPARYCFGYLPDIDVPPPSEPMDFAAWLEAYVGGHWYTFDPRNNARRTGRVVIGRGRDALDVAMMTTYGSAPLTAMRVAAEPLSARPWSTSTPPVCGDFGPTV
ncbi:MAG TPA: transglutaminase family protein [Candidatus Dormibacteraeota bacterium]|nr:transglutaminase family protein [Candidatus Dormibacteraeota bacterium]